MKIKIKGSYDEFRCFCQNATKLINDLLYWERACNKDSEDTENEYMECLYEQVSWECSYERPFPEECYEFIPEDNYETEILKDNDEKDFYDFYILCILGEQIFPHLYEREKKKFENSPNLEVLVADYKENNLYYNLLKERIQ